MQLRHISPRSSDWKDAMDEGEGARGWERLAPEEREKLLKDRREETGDLKRAGPTGSIQGHGHGFMFASPSK